MATTRPDPPPPLTPTRWVDLFPSTLLEVSVCVYQQEAMATLLTPSLPCSQTDSFLLVLKTFHLRLCNAIRLFWTTLKKKKLFSIWGGGGGLSSR